jgi:SpoVK/Ycf46/Vps4 family AAA+-type ATPase
MQALHNIKDQLIEMNNMIGMQGIKCNVVDQILYFVQELHKGKRTTGDFMHTVIYGPPGTGKTEVAKIIGKIYSNIGVLSKATFKKVTRSDLIAGYLGQTAVKTRDVIKEALGGVLFIDEAYALGNPEKRDSFSKECIDTLCEALSDHKDNLMVIIAGYEKELNECFFDYNQGLNSRFTWRFKVDSYSGKELMQIFIKKVDENGWTINVNDITSDWFDKNMEYFKYYGRDVEVLFTKTKIAHSRRVFCKPASEKTIITFPDIENGFKLFLNNDEVKNRKKHSDIQSDIKFSMYN